MNEDEMNPITSRHVYVPGSVWQIPEEIPV